MAEDNQVEDKPGIIGGLVGRVASGVYEGVKGGVVGLGVGAATGGIISSLTPDTIGSLGATIGEGAEKLGLTSNPITSAVENFGNVGLAESAQKVAQLSDSVASNAAVIRDLSEKAVSSDSIVREVASGWRDVIEGGQKETIEELSKEITKGENIAKAQAFINLDGVKTAIVDFTKSAAETLGYNTTNPVETTIKQGLTSLAENVTATQGAAIGAVAGGTLGTFNGLTGNSSAADRTLSLENKEQTSQINQLAMATQNLGVAAQMLGGAVVGTQNELAKTNQAVQTIGKHTKDTLLAHADHVHGTQTGSFVAKEEARRHAAAHAPKTLGA